ncbi:hypothetical protein BDU57DRAFT_511047 [Ampelomyces quisqualis]|uniref:Uncharacterized protein n=1 Tax=Ampelomyces quisqualis TaxID=50730 RepID=A0A6A5R5B3_AMPQU|nr:hypothetical protein BDU57DRAFT_511047 [Ampelomyces quisqualis]
MTSVQRPCGHPPRSRRDSYPVLSHVTGVSASINMTTSVYMQTVENMPTFKHMSDQPVP